MLVSAKLMPAKTSIISFLNGVVQADLKSQSITKSVIISFGAISDFYQEADPHVKMHQFDRFISSSLLVVEQ